MGLSLPRRPGLSRIDPALAVVNIVLLLIFFFLSAGQPDSAAGRVELARTRHLPPDSLPAPVLELAGPEQWFLDGQPVRPELLAAALDGQDLPLHVMIDRHAPAGLLLELMRSPGIEGRDIRLVTRPEGPAP